MFVVILLLLLLVAFLPALLGLFDAVVHTVEGLHGEVGGGQVDFLLGELQPFLDHAAYTLVIAIRDFQDALAPKRGLFIVVIRI